MPAGLYWFAPQLWHTVFAAPALIVPGAHERHGVVASAPGWNWLGPHAMHAELALVLLYWPDAQEMHSTLSVVRGIGVPPPYFPATHSAQADAPAAE